MISMGGRKRVKRGKSPAVKEGLEAVVTPKKGPIGGFRDRGWGEEAGGWKKAEKNSRPNGHDAIGCILPGWDC